MCDYPHIPFGQLKSSVVETGLTRRSGDPVVIEAHIAAAGKKMKKKEDVDAGSPQGVVHKVSLPRSFGGHQLIARFRRSES